MKTSSTLAFAVSAALVGAQGLTYNATTGTFVCAIPDAAYCATDSLAGNIIIRCNGLVGHPGNCNDNLDAEFPYGVNYAPCFQTSAYSGDAACTKNCVIYGASGNYKGTNTVIPGCIPQDQPTTSSSSTSSTITPTTTSSNSTQTKSKTSNSSTTTVPSHWITPITYTPPTTTTATSTTNSTPIHSITPITYHTPTLITLTTAPTSAPSPINNGTTTASTSSGNNSQTHTNIPVGPTTTKNSGPVVFTGVAASANGKNACVGTVLVMLSTILAMCL